ncbi:MAG: CDP-glycerol glycerophosphotransferase family protein [Gammaproteobacteria bacterium]|nr:CDP-glycerol glycerophosphotransferase family protein [Gammaproteobacteria bacterium]
MTKKYLLYAVMDYSFAILRPLQAAIRARGDECAWFLADQAAESGYLHADERRLKTVNEVKAWAADATFVPGNTVPDFFPGYKVAVFHGFNARKRTRGKLDSHFTIRGCFDLYCTQGPSTTQVFEQLAKAHGYFRVQETGWPKVDPLFGKSLSNNQTGCLTILLTSTFSRRLSCAPHLLDEWSELIHRRPEWKFQTQFHPKMPAETIHAYKNIKASNYEFIETDDMNPYLSSADIMVSDTSSILQEFLLLEKPVITYQTRFPEPHLINIMSPTELEKAILEANSKPSELIENIHKYIQKLHPYKDGHSSSRVIDATEWFIREGNIGLKKKPINLIRKLKDRKKLKYWKI